MNILIAEDNMLLQKSFGMLMKYWGFDFDVAGNGQEAVERAVANEGKYDLCLMDIDMPIMDGCEAAQTIRREVEYFPIMALSGNAYIEKICADAGMDDYIAKPCEPERLLGKINELTIKLLKLDYKKGYFDFKKEMPMNQAELKELRELKNKGLTKLKLVGTDYTFVVHKNIQNKISHDLIAEGKELTEFIDRSENEPGKCHLYKVNLHVTKDLFIPEELEEALKQEDQIALRFDKPSDIKKKK
ncbi:MAG: response regulator [Deltaproteobacteria bacterium]|nr:response regulator [Deltaproteobacteria bacterium]